MNKPITTFKEYQVAALSTSADFPASDEPWYVSMGISGEAGEIADGLKKAYRKFGSFDKVPEDVKQHLLSECGDTLWYLSKMCKLLGGDLQTAANINIKKLAARKEKGTIVDSSKRDKADT
jgi:NTP pyrophosphatase (non-canonical NTP hydrolase)